MPSRSIPCKMMLSMIGISPETHIICHMEALRSPQLSKRVGRCLSASSQAGSEISHSKATAMPITAGIKKELLQPERAMQPGTMR